MPPASLEHESVQLVGSRAAMSSVNESPELIDEVRLLLSSFEDDHLSKLVHNDSFEMLRAGTHHHLFDDTKAAFDHVHKRLGPSTM